MSKEDESPAAGKTASPQTIERARQLGRQITEALSGYGFRAGSTVRHYASDYIEPLVRLCTTSAILGIVIHEGGSAADAAAHVAGFGAEIAHVGDHVIVLEVTDESSAQPAYSNTTWRLSRSEHNPLGLSCIHAGPGSAVGTIVQMGARSPADADEQAGNARLIVAAVNLFLAAARAHSTNAVLLAERLETAGFADIFDARPTLPDVDGPPPAHTPRPWRLYTDDSSPQGLTQITSRHCRFVSILEMFASDPAQRAEQVGNARLIKAAVGALLKTAEIWDVNPVLLAEALPERHELILALPHYRPRVNNC